MGESRDVVLRPRSGEGGERTFRPHDFPELWQQGKGRAGLGVFTKIIERQPASAEAAAIWKMFVPEELGQVDAEESHLNFPRGNDGRFDLSISGDRFEVGDLNGWIDSAKGDIPAMMEISDYEDVDFDQKGGSQAFYRNLAHQLGNMDIPILYGQKVPWSLGYFIHRVGQVPIALLDDRFQTVRDHLAHKIQRPLSQLQSDFPSFSYTLAMHDVEPRQLVAPQYRDKLHEMQQVFDRMTPEQRAADYVPILKQKFGLTDR